MPLARPIGPPVAGVVAALTVGVVAHLVAAVAMGYAAGQLPVSGLGPALSLAGLALAASLLLAEVIVRDVTLSLIAAPLAAGVTAAAVMFGWHPAGEPGGVRGAWMASHVALSFVGLAALATAAAAGALYLVERRELKSRSVRVGVPIISASRDARSHQSSECSGCLGCADARRGARRELCSCVWSVCRTAGRVGRVGVVGCSRTRGWAPTSRVARPSGSGGSDDRIWVGDHLLSGSSGGGSAAGAFPVMARGCTSRPCWFETFGLHTGVQ